MPGIKDNDLCHKIYIVPLLRNKEILLISWILKSLKFKFFFNSKKNPCFELDMTVFLIRFNAHFSYFSQMHKNCVTNDLFGYV